MLGPSPGMTTHVRYPVRYEVPAPLTPSSSWPGSSKPKPGHDDAWHTGDSPRAGGPHAFVVVAGLVPAIHVFDAAAPHRRGSPGQARG